MNVEDLLGRSEALRLENARKKTDQSLTLMELYLLDAGTRAFEEMYQRGVDDEGAARIVALIPGYQSALDKWTEALEKALNPKRISRPLSSIH